MRHAAKEIGVTIDEEKDPKDTGPGVLLTRWVAITEEHEARGFEQGMLLRRLW